MPDDYPIFQAARWLGVAPWELFERGIYWTNRARVFAQAEALVQRDRERRNRHRR